MSGWTKGFVWSAPTYRLIVLGRPVRPRSNRRGSGRTGTFLPLPRSEKWVRALSCRFVNKDGHRIPGGGVLCAFGSGVQCGSGPAGRGNSWEAWSRAPPACALNGRSALCSLKTPSRVTEWVCFGRSLHVAAGRAMEVILSQASGAGKSTPPSEFTILIYGFIIFSRWFHRTTTH